MNGPWLVLLLPLGCAPDPAPTPARGTPYTLLEGAPLARRISLDLRGVSPTLEELARAGEDGGVDALVDAWLEDPSFEEHLVDVFAEGWLLRVDELRVETDEFGVTDDAYAFTRAFGDEPARLMARVAAEDRPWSEVVTADWTMANATLAAMVPVTFTDPSDTSEWKEARYTDGRPAGGVLMTSGLWMRYHTTLFNYNRARASVLARYLLCYDFLARPVSFSGVTGSSGEELQEATRTQPGCVSCHAGLDPLASALFGFWPYEDKDGVELVRYHPERERYGEAQMGLAPAYFGTPVDAASQLGPLVAADPRFETCVVERTATWLWGRSPGADELGALTELRAAFADGELRYKALVRAVVATETYRASGLTDAATDEERARATTLRHLTPTTLASTVEDLTGFRWTYDGWDLMDSDEIGYRVLLGGADGLTVRTPTYDPTVSRSLTVRRLAEAAADHAVARDLRAPPAERRLVGTTVEDPAVLEAGSAELDAELTAVHTRVLGRAPTEEERAELETFFVDAQAAGGAHAAWVGVVSLLMRDPEFWSY